MKRYSAAITIIGTGAIASAAQAQQSFWTVRSVVDGDTLWAQNPFSGQMQKIRLSHIDAPEITQAGGEFSKAQLQELLPNGSQIQVDQLTVTNSLMVAEVTNSQGQLINLDMVQQGAAVTYHPFSFGGVPTIYTQAEAQAQLASTGIWGNQAFDMSPAQYRIQHAEMPLTGGAPWFAAFAPPVQLSPRVLGIGGLGVLGMVVLAKVLWPSPRKTSDRPSLRQMRSDLKKTKRALQDVLASQKLLERQHDQAQAKVEEWLQRADLALKSEDQNLADQALIHKGTHAQQADQVKLSLDEVSQQVETMRQTVANLEAQIEVEQKRREC